MGRKVFSNLKTAYKIIKTLILLSFHKFVRRSIRDREFSSEISLAELTGKRHADVMRDIRVMLVELELGERNFASSYLSEQNKGTACFSLPKRESLILVSGYSKEIP